MSKIKVAALQIPTVAEKMENLNTVRTYLEKLKEEKPDFVILPEMFCCPYQTENFPVYAEESPSDTLLFSLDTPSETCPRFSSGDNCSAPAASCSAPFT